MSLVRVRPSAKVAWRRLNYCMLIWITVSPAYVSAESALAAGKDRFQRNCGICHGIDGKGGGAFTELLKVSPPDLTVLSRNNHGSFPFSDVYNSIDGRNFPLAHANSNMPSWGERYKQSVEDGNETLVRGRILELICSL